METFGDLNDAFDVYFGSPTPGAVVKNAASNLSGFGRHRHREGDWRSRARAASLAENRAPIRVLLVHSHSDDESESAALIYRLTHELGASVDRIVATDSEAERESAALAEAYYDLPLTADANRQELFGQIRREELIRSGRIIGIRNNYFIDGPESGFEPDAAGNAGAQEDAGAQEIAAIRQELRILLRFEKYDVVIVRLPSPDAYRHQQTVAALALEAVNELDPQDRPAALGVRAVTAGYDDMLRFSELTGSPLTKTVDRLPDWGFDRSTPLSCQGQLDHTIVIDWVMNEHKSHVSVQRARAPRTHEHFWLFEVGGISGAARWREIVRKLEQSAFARERQALALTA
jgi:LmbE family N-acetylglucosaminyl deacetylase